MADELQIMKRTKHGVMMNFNVSRLDDFFLDDGMAIDDLLTPADRQIIVNYALNSIRAAETDRALPGSESVQFYHGESVVARCEQEGIIKVVYSLHDVEHVRRTFGPPWYRPLSFEWQPIEAIREYFGEALGIYFAFLGEIGGIAWIKFCVVYHLLSASQSSTRWC